MPAAVRVRQVRARSSAAVRRRSAAGRSPAQYASVAFFSSRRGPIRG